MRTSQTITRLRCLLFLLMLGAAHLAYGEDYGMYSHQSWSTEEGLPQSSVHQIFQSRDGYLWLATEGGVVRFDGLSFKVLRHESNPSFVSDDISSIAQDLAGALWFGTADGLIRYEGGQTRRFSDADGLSFSSILSLSVAGDGSLLVVTDHDLARYDGKSFRRLKSFARPVFAAKNPADGSVWLLTGDEELQYRNGDLQTAHLPKGSVLEGAKGFRFGPESAIWSWKGDGVSVVVAGANRRWDIGKDLPGTRVESLSLDREGNAWVGTNRGLVVVSPQSKNVTAVPELKTDAILCSFEDQEGNHWIGSDTSGLHVLRSRKFHGDPAVAGESVTTVVQTTDGAAWYATRDEGLIRNDHGAVTQPLRGDPFTRPVVLALAPGLHGDLWFGTPDGLNHLEGQQIHRYTAADGLPDDFIRSILVDHDGSVWIGTRHGLAHLQKNHIATINSGEDSSNDLIGMLFQPRWDTAKDGLLQGASSASDLWFSTLSGLTRLHHGTATHYSERDGLPGGIVTGVAQDEAGELWISTKDGTLSKFAGNRFVAVNSAELPRDIEALVADGHGFLWLQSRRGISRVSVAELSACTTNVACRLIVGRYGTSDGMPSDEAPENGFPTLWKANDEELWFATRKGVAIVNYVHLPMNNVAPPVVVERFSVDDTEVPIGSGTPRFSYGHRRYTFDYAGLSYTLPSKVEYRFLLEGFDRQWTFAGTRRTAYYTSLPPGEYRFRVQAANDDGVWNETGAEVRFIVLSPFYRSWWFYAALLILIPAMIYGLYRLRVQRMQTRFDLVLGERNRMAREIHDTLVQDFIGVSLQLEIVSRMLGSEQVSKAAQQLRKTRSLVREGLDAARQSIWNLRESKDQDELPTRVGAAIRRLTDSGPSYKLVVSGVYRPLQRATENEILRIAQEALFNVERHAEAGIVAVDLLYMDDRLALTVRDDGRGFSVDAGENANGHYGLQGMKERADALGAQLIVTSAPGDGTTVQLIVPLRED